MTTANAGPVRYSGRSMLWLALFIAALGIACYALQIQLGRLTAPWYLPISTTIAAVLAIVSVWQMRSIWRGMAALLIVLLAAGEWAFLIGTRLPAYAGPVAVGKPFPAFSTIRVDGSPFTQKDLEGDQHNVLVFFRGRW